jgi:hypothetical protein
MHTALVLAAPGKIMNTMKIGGLMPVGFRYQGKA